MSETKKQSRVRRARRSRLKMRELGVNRLSVHRTPQHIYAQIIAPEGDRVLASASTLDESLRSGSTGNASAAAKVGQLIAERAKFASDLDKAAARAKRLDDTAAEVSRRLVVAMETVNEVLRNA